MSFSKNSIHTELHIVLEQKWCFSDFNYIHNLDVIFNRNRLAETNFYKLHFLTSLIYYILIDELILAVETIKDYRHI